MGLLAANLPKNFRIGTVLAVIVLVLIDTSDVRRIPFPANNRQVHPSIQQRKPELGAAIFGFEMGTGVRTLSPTGLPHLGAISAVAFAPLASIPLALGFATGRALMVAGALHFPAEWLTKWNQHRRVQSWSLASVSILSVAAILRGLQI
jgi:hypothetical protein